MKKNLIELLKGNQPKEKEVFEKEYSFKMIDEEDNKVFENKKGEQVIYCY